MFDISSDNKDRYAEYLDSISVGCSSFADLRAPLRFGTLAFDETILTRNSLAGDSTIEKMSKDAKIEAQMNFLEMINVFNKEKGDTSLQGVLGSIQAFTKEFSD